MFVVQASAIGLPRWLWVGILVGIALSVGVAGVFLVGARRFPTPSVTAGPRRDGDARRRLELRRYLDAIDEAYAEDHLVDGHTVAFYLPARDVAITFDPRAFYAIGRSDTHAVLVEHEMPGAHLGARLPFDTPSVDLDGDDGTDRDRSRAEVATSAAYATLGVASTASPAEVKDAYRERIKDTHPDHDGDREAFQRVQEAYAVIREVQDNGQDRDRGEVADDAATTAARSGTTGRF